MGLIYTSAGAGVGAAYWLSERTVAITSPPPTFWASNYPISFGVNSCAYASLADTTYSWYTAPCYNTTLKMKFACEYSAPGNFWLVNSADLIYDVECQCFRYHTMTISFCF